MEQYKYYAFISYSRKNSSAAAYLHKSLERFRIPVKYVPEELRPAGQKFLRPIFRDRRDLEVRDGSFTNDIRIAIEQSRYLIVLCSPDAAGSVWVNEEVKHFLATHNNDIAAVVPVILTGKPGHGGNEECLPPVLCVEPITGRNLASMIPDEGEPERSGWENGVVQALSYMLRVNREKIKATVDAERIRLLRLNLLIGAIVLLGFAALTLWAIRAERAATANEQLAQQNAEEARANEQRAIAGEKQAKENEAKAKEQAEIAKKSLEFLRDMFQSSDPSKKGSKDMKVLDAIRAKIPEIEKLEPWQLRASVALEVGLVLSNIGDYENAAKLYNVALELNRKYRTGTREEARVHNDLCVLYMRLDKRDDAQKHLLAQQRILTALYGENSPKLYPVYCSKAMIEHRNGNFTEALSLMEKAIEFLQAKDDANSGEAVALMNNLSALYLEQEDYANAISICLYILDFLKKHGNEGTYDYAHACHSLAGAYVKIHKFAEAEKYQKIALSSFQKLFGDLHPSTISAYGSMAVILQHNNEQELALSCAQKAWSASEQLYGREHQQSVTACFRLGQLYAHNLQFDKALAYLNDAVALSTKVSGSEHPETLRYKNELENIRKLADEKELSGQEKEQIFKDSIELNKMPGNIQKKCEEYGNAFLLSYEEEKITEALAFLQKKIDLQAKYIGEDNPAMIPDYDLAALIYAEQNNNKKVAVFRKKILQIEKNKLGEKHPDLIPIYEQIGCALMNIDNPEALNAFTEMLSILELQKNREKDRIYAMLYIAKTYCLLNNKEKAMEYAQKARGFAESLGSAYKKECKLCYDMINQILYYSLLQDLNSEQ